ncbi:hypothetical protein FS837_012223 [Tulasnella sp. UAMH 9824]|nr:hypothetical protein FS837_012223 [Tulasnella sp. UAMH 9824]
MSARTPPTKKRALIEGMPLELIARFFALSDKQACVAACLVCRRWSGAAFDELRRSLPSLVPLFEVLGPLMETEKGRVRLGIIYNAGELFKSYATRVRCITYDDDEDDAVISTGLIIQALTVHPGGILPNLRALHWQVYDPGLTQILAFCPPSLERLSLHVGNEYLEVDSVKRLLSGLSFYLANRLKFFGFGTAFSISDNGALSASLNAFLNSQSGLLEVKLPYYEIQDPATISAVCRASPQLRTFCGEVQDVTKKILLAVLNELAGRSASLRCVRLISESHEEEI